MSRNLYTLIPPMFDAATAFLDDCKIAGIDVIVTCARRTMEEQAALYAQGRTTPGHIVTNAQPGQSAHNYGCAIDVVPSVNGKPVWEFDPKVDPWKTVGALGQARGLQWLGAPGSPFVEGCHFQLPDWKNHMGDAT